MSSYWKKKLDELNEQNAKSTSVTPKATKTTKSNDYWGNKLTELENANKKKKEDEDEIAPVLSTPKKDKDEDGANLWELTWKSLERGFYNSRYGEESYAAMMGEDNEKDKYARMLAEDEYQFTPNGKIQQGVSGAFELLGQQVRQFTNPSSVILAGGMAGAAAVAGQAGPQVLLPEEVITVPGAFATGLTMGSTKANFQIEAGLAYNEMVEAGISEETAKKVALGVGGVNASLEMLQVDDLVKAFKVTKAAGTTKNFSQKILDELVERGVDIAKETAQEVAQEGVTIAGTQMASKHEKGEWAYTTEDVAGRLADTAVSSALSFGMMNVPAGVLNISNIATEQKKKTTLTDNEQKVIDKEYENRIAEQEQDGRKLTKQEKSKIYDTVVSDMEKGYISTDTIEEVLGGDTYKSYKDTVDSEDALTQEYEELGKKQNATLAEQTRYNELHEQMKNRDDSQRKELKSRLSEEVMGLVQNDRLAESYNERTRRGQAFEADLTKYDAKQQTVIQKAVESGILNNTNRTHEFVDMIAKISADKGVLFDFTNNEKLKGTSFAVDGKTVNGFVNENGVTLNIDSAKSLNSVVGHEITHVLEGTDLYDVLQKTIVDYAKSKGDYQDRYDTISRLYADQKGANIDAELTSDLVGDYLFTDSDFIHNLSTNHRNVFQKIYDEIKYLCKVATAGSKEARELEKVKRAFDKAYKEGGKSTSGTDTRFSLSESVEETKDLMALHNLQSSELLKTLDLGGLPMPSVAIIKSDASHEDYGDVSLVLPKEAIDPKTNKNNKVYGGDAWTPTYPKIEYKPKDKVAQKIRDKYYGLAEKIGYDAVRPMYRYVSELEDVLNRDGGEAGMLERLYEDTDMMNVYLQDSGKGKVEPIVKETVTKISEAQEELNQFFIDALGEDVISDFKAPEGAKIGLHRRAFMEKHGDAIRATYKRYFMEQHNFSEEEASDSLASVPSFELMAIVRNAYQYTQDKGVTVQEETDIPATREAIRNAASDGYKEWVDDLFKGVQEKSGIRNNKDYYTPSGNPRSWNSLHWENTLENVVKAMKEQDDTGTDSFNPFNNLFSKAHKRYGSIAEIKADSNRLNKIPEDEYEALKNSFSSRFADIANSIKDTEERNPFIAVNNAAELIVDAVRTQKTKSGMLNYLRKWNSRATTQTVDDVVSLISDIAEMPTGYFEAKPQRAVGLDEVGVFVIPNNADAKLKQELLSRGYSVAEYDPNVEGDRQRVVNGFEEYKFNLSDATADRRTFGNYNVYGEDIALETAPVAENVASEATSEDFAPMSEPIPGQFESLSDADAPVEMDAPYYGDEEAETFVDDPFESRYMDEVGNPKVKAYMYENPEVKPFFQQEAAIMLRELQDSTKGQKLYNDKLYYDTNGEQGWFGQTRNTSEQIAYLLDGGWGGKGYTYAEIEKGLKAIIEDNGKENNACSKRIEFLLNDRLKDGYTDFRDGSEIPPDDGYLSLLEEKQITEYSKEAFDALVEDGDEYAPSVQYDIESNDPAPTPEALLPDENEVGGTTRQNAKGQQKLFPESEESKPPVQQEMWPDKTAKILTEEPPKNKNQRGLWSMFKEYVLDNGMVFEDLSLKTGNRELQAKWHYIRNARAMAQSFMGKGKNGARALNDLRQMVENSGKMQSFSEYAYHLLNVDRMTLAQRYEGMENKPVFGNHVTAEQSAQKAVQLERANPEFKRWANELYTINTQLREMLVEGGVLSRETANLWAEMYPHYIPIRRAGYEGAAINVALDTNRTGVNAPIKKATGGNRDILPMFDTMGQRTLQTYRAIAKNNFGLELRKTLGTTVSEDAAGLDSVIDSMDNEEGLLTKGDKNKAPTFTVFENGKRYTFEITDEMYESMKPTSDLLSYTNPVANVASNAFRGLLTEYNPVFMMSNAIKDAQDVLINSQHPARTYMAMPKAIGEMMSGGNYYREYMENGGEENTYFDGQENTFDTKEKGARKLLGIPPLSWISKANNVIERLPRMAEYIASREDGRSIEVSMLDAARVTTNFAAGGKLTKFANRNGVTFLNASVQGAVQQARNIREAKANGLKGAVYLAAKVAVAGLPAMLVNHLLWDDDEDYEELSDYVKQDYYIVGKTEDGQFIRIPKGRTLAVIQSAFEQMENLVTGDDEVDLKAFLDLAVANLAPNNPIENNILAPIKQVAENKTWYGEDLVPTRLQDLPKAEQFDESTDSLSKWLGERQPFLSPYQINYLLDQYSGGVGDVFLPMLTPEAESGDNSLVGNFLAPLKKKFTTDAVMNNQNVSDFYDTKDELATNAKRRGATDEDVLKSKYFNSINAELSDLYAQKREIQNSTLPDDAKYEAVRDIQSQIVELTKEALNDYPNVSISGNYAEIGNRQYRKNDTGEWTKLSDKQTEKQDEVTGSLDISASEYWRNKDEYDFAYEKPEKYAVAKSVGGYTAYKDYTKQLYDIKGDDLNGDGRSDSGTRKKKVLDWINNLDADYGTKIILFKNEYNADDTYNYEIIEYLNSRSDISAEEMAAILKELGFEVDSKGNISW